MMVGVCAAELACPPETDPESPRHSALGKTASDNILRTDLDSDGDPDIIELWHGGKRLRWFDENDDATAFDVWGDMVHDALQVDMDGDGYYDGPADYCVKWADTDGDGAISAAEYAAAADWMQQRAGQRHGSRNGGQRPFWRH